MELVGKILADRYEIREEIGKGGMAHVYKAWCNLLNRYVAIKVLKEEFRDDKEFVHRFNVEAQAAAGISNPHVVSIYDVGYQEGFYYIVMEYIEGVILKEYISQKGSLPWKEAVSIAAQICEGLVAAHKSKVVHRDIKPQNIIMTPEGILKVTDFGIAKASSQTTTTTGGQAIGTVHYISPEQARGGYTDQRTDIYSLGVVLYEMLAGKMPFVGESPVAVAIKHIQEKPTSLRKLKADIPEMVEKVVFKAMAKEQNARYATAEEFLKDLNRALETPSRKAGEFGVMDEEEMGSTIKMEGISDESIETYEEVHARPDRTKSAEQRREAGGEVRRVRSETKSKAQKKKDRMTTWIAILAGLLVVILVGAAFTAMTGGIQTSPDKIAVPNLVGMDLDSARNKYGEFNIVLSEEKKSEKKVGVILEQTPKYGEKVFDSENIVIQVVVSAGKDTVVVSSYLDLESEKAQARVRKDGFQVNVEERSSDTAKEGVVFAQEPVAGSTVSEGALITLYVSKGPKEGEEKPEDVETPTEKETSEPANNQGENNEEPESETSGNSQTGSSTTGQSDPNSGTGTGGGTSSGTGSGTSSGTTPNPSSTPEQGSTGSSGGSGGTVTAPGIGN